jgi:hypothetical protein
MSVSPWSPFWEDSDEPDTGDSLPEMPHYLAQAFEAADASLGAAKPRDCPLFNADHVD